MKNRFTALSNRGQVIMRKSPRVFAEHAFLFTLALVLLAFLVATALFYFYVWIPQHKEPGFQGAVISFREHTFQEIRTTQEQRMERFEGADSLQERNIFQVPQPQSPTPTPSPAASPSPAAP